MRRAHGRRALECRIRWRTSRRSTNRVLDGLGARPGMLGVIFKNAGNDIRNPALLKLFWLKDKSLTDMDALPPPDVIATEIADDLQAALTLFSKIALRLQKPSWPRVPPSFNACPWRRAGRWGIPPGAKSRQLLSTGCPAGPPCCQRGATRCQDVPASRSEVEPPGTPGDPSAGVRS